MGCRSGCSTKDHASYGECVRSSVHFSIVDATREKKWQKELDAYWAARRQGIQPAGTRLADTREAVDLSNDLGFAVDAGRAI